MTIPQQSNPTTYLPVKAPIGQRHHPAVPSSSRSSPSSDLPPEPRAADGAPVASAFRFTLHLDHVGGGDGTLARVGVPAYRRRRPGGILGNASAGDEDRERLRCRRTAAGGDVRRWSRQCHGAQCAPRCSRGLRLGGKAAWWSGLARVSLPFALAPLSRPG